MQTLVLLGMLFVLSTAGCSGSSDTLLGTDADIRPSVDPAGKEPHSCEIPEPISHRVSFSRSLSGASSDAARC
jgi:hypothetical protein